ncbi:hypothetical protein HIM_09654 [Hirsutella minnesotensis 3608]|uniref:Agmatinase 1 n=1 Tax=Hirsutella minnesotensis 3608 TaxID=1043627 RepID=A0A0F7ZL60_9HYPO|nr:hypothetical protein HIM_09654 [Hirsutella minnesotensis 3608]
MQTPSYVSLLAWTLGVLASQLLVEGRSIAPRQAPDSNTTAAARVKATELSSPFNGLTTFNSVDYGKCFRIGTPAVKDRYDIAILGAPNDLTVTGRPGARFGPGAIRAAASESDFGYSIFTGRDAFSQGAKIVDCGDVSLSWTDKQEAFQLLDQAHQRVSEKPAANTSWSQHPRILTLGGDHATTISALRSVHRVWGKVAVVHIDTHLDTGGSGRGLLLNYKDFDHGTVLHFAHEEGLTSDSSIHAGIHSAFGSAKDFEVDKRDGYEVIANREIDKIGASGVVEKIHKRVGQNRVYLSVDIDVLDPAYAPGTGTPVVGGWTSRELLTVLNGLNGLNVVGADIVEVSPAYDSPGKTTALAAAQVVAAFIDIMLARPAI